MGFIIAISGKGGVGKTTIAALITARLIRRGCTPVLAVDADPNTCLDAALGVKIGKTVGGVREETKVIAGEGMAAGISKQEFLELKIGESLVEAEDFDLLAMGRPEGPGCYCYANNVLKAVLGEISNHYPYVVLDNEAGLENLSRRLVQHVNLLVMVTDPSRRGIDTLERLHGMTREMGIQYEQLAVVINRSRQERIPDHAAMMVQRMGADHLIGLPEDEELARINEEGVNLMELPDSNPVVRGIDDLLERVKGIDDHLERPRGIDDNLERVNGFEHTQTRDKEHL